MQNRKISSAEQDLVAAFFLIHREEADTEEFAKLGNAFVEKEVVPRALLPNFHKAVAKLEEVNCYREVIYRSLYGLYSAETKAPEFPDSDCAHSIVAAINVVLRGSESLNNAMSSPIWQESERNMTTFHAAVNRELKEVEDNPEVVVSDGPENWSEAQPWSEMPPELLQGDRWLDLLATRVLLLARIDRPRILKKAKVPTCLCGLAFCAWSSDNCTKLLQLLMDPATTDDLQRGKKQLAEYSGSPRRDILVSYARARCSLYPTVATGGQEHFELVADLLNSFEPTRQDAQLVSKNLKYFEHEHPFPYLQLDFSLRKEHETARSQSGKL